MRGITAIIVWICLTVGGGLCNEAAALDATWSDSPSIHLLLGGQDTVGGGTTALNQHTSSWEGIYEQPNFVSHFGLQIRYLNEGYLGATRVPWDVHVDQPLHYRDAYGMQFSYWSPLLGTCRLGAALGPEIYFDTFTGSYRSQYEDRHGIGAQPSLAVQCRISKRWALELMADRSFDVASFDATAVLLGFTYTPRYAQEVHGSETAGDEGTGDGRPSGRYLELTAGRTEVDCFHMSDEIGTAIWATYGQRLSAPLALEVSLLNESVSGILQRRGLAPQLIAEHEFSWDHIQVFVGVGPEFSRYRDEVARTLNTQINLLLSYGMRVPLLEQTSVVLRFGRLESSSGKNDTDLLSVGVAIGI